MRKPWRGSKFKGGGMAATDELRNLSDDAVVQIVGWVASVIMVLSMLPLVLGGCH